MTKPTISVLPAVTPAAGTVTERVVPVAARVALVPTFWTKAVVARACDQGAAASRAHASGRIHEPPLRAPGSWIECMRARLWIVRIMVFGFVPLDDPVAELN
jgi:hypothetical protein